MFSAARSLCPADAPSPHLLGTRHTLPAPTSDSPHPDAEPPHPPGTRQTLHAAGRRATAPAGDSPHPPCTRTQSPHSACARWGLTALEPDWLRRWLWIQRHTDSTRLKHVGFQHHSRSLSPLQFSVPVLLHYRDKGPTNANAVSKPPPESELLHRFWRNLLMLRLQTQRRGTISNINPNSELHINMKKPSCLP